MFINNKIIKIGGILMNIYVFVLVGAMVLVLLGIFLMCGRGIKFGERSFWAPGNGSITMVPYWEVLCCTAVAGAMVGALVFCYI